ncbi:hypothetical protein [Myxosarcina sp. GI1(2024)]
MQLWEEKITRVAIYLRSLRQAGIPVVSDEEFVRSLADLEHRRRLLLGLVERNSFRWPK